MNNEYYIKSCAKLAMFSEKNKKVIKLWQREKILKV